MNCHIVIVKLQIKVLKLLPVSSNDQIIDFFHVTPSSSTFQCFTIQIRIIDIYQPATCEGILYHKQIDNNS